jgi:hypothetical protein
MDSVTATLNSEDTDYLYIQVGFEEIPMEKGKLSTLGMDQTLLEYLVGARLQANPQAASFEDKKALIEGSPFTANG